MAADAETKPAVKLPPTKPYRVCIGGAMYQAPTLVVGYDGVESVVYATRLGERGEEIELTDREAHRLKGLAAVKPKGEPLSYDEMSSKQLDDAVKAAGITVTSSSADADRPLPADKINALRTHDQGRGVAP